MFVNHFGVRRAVVGALVRLDRLEAMGELIRFLADVQGEARADILKYLSAVTGQNFVGDAKAWATWWRQNQREFRPAAAGCPGRRRHRRGRHGLLLWIADLRPKTRLCHRHVGQHGGRSAGRCQARTDRRDPQPARGVAICHRRVQRRRRSLAEEAGAGQQGEQGGGDGLCAVAAGAVLHRFVRCVGDGLLVRRRGDLLSVRRRTDHRQVCRTGRHHQRHLAWATAAGASRSIRSASLRDCPTRRWSGS